MARIRSVHPDLCTDETLAEVSASAERTFVRLWTHLDDEGRCLDNPRLLKAALYPLHDTMDSRTVDADLDELAAAGVVQRYVADGKRYLSAKRGAWNVYQKPRHPTPSKYPAPAAPSVRPTAKRRKPPAKVPPLPEGDCGVCRGVVVGEGEGEGEGETLPVAAAPGGGRTLVVDFWQASEPKPAVKFIALVKLVDRFLEAGWPAPDVTTALHETRAFTIDAIEYTLRAKVQSLNGKAAERYAGIRHLIETPEAS